MYYILCMANILPKDKQIAVVSMLAEGSSIRAIERITGINRNTIMNLGVRIGQGCAKLMDAKMRDLTCHFLQFDEIWGFIGKKEKHRMIEDDPTLGDVWTFCAVDAETKLVPSFKVGKRTHVTANALCWRRCLTFEESPADFQRWYACLCRSGRERFRHERRLRNDH
jgi:hypothetical protein